MPSSPTSPTSPGNLPVISRQLKKAIEQHNQCQKVLAARQKTLVTEKAALEEEERSLAEHKAEVERRSPFVTHAKPFFEWLAASDEESDDEGKDSKPKEIS